MSGSAEPRPLGFPFTRRQFGLLVVGGATAAAVGSQLVAAQRAPDSPAGYPPSRTSFGTVRIDRAKRMARFGSGTFAPAADGAVDHGHGAALPRAADITREPPNRTWADIVVLWLSVQNSSAAPVYVSSGQLRLRIPKGNITVAPRNSAVTLLEVPARVSGSAWVSYLAPAGVHSPFLADFTDPALDNPITLALPTALPAAEARSGGEPWAA